MDERKAVFSKSGASHSFLFSPLFLIAPKLHLKTG